MHLTRIRITTLTEICAKSKVNKLAAKVEVCKILLGPGYVISFNFVSAQLLTKINDFFLRKTGQQSQAQTWLPSLPRPLFDVIVI